MCGEHLQIKNTDHTLPELFHSDYQSQKKAQVLTYTPELYVIYVRKRTYTAEDCVRYVILQCFIIFGKQRLHMIKIFNN